MKDSALVFFLITISTSICFAEESNKSLASTLEIYVFPGDGQKEDQQSKDKGECYEWAAGNTGVDPFDLQKMSQETEQKTEQQIQQAVATRGGSTAGNSKILAVYAWKKKTTWSSSSGNLLG